MQKRKSPIALVTVLVVLALVGAFINFKAQGTKEGKELLIQSPKEATGPSRETQGGNEALVSNVRQGAAATSKPGEPKGAMPAPNTANKMGVPSGALVQKISGAATKQKPNDSSVQGQWWSKDHAQLGEGG